MDRMNFAAWAGAGAAGGRAIGSDAMLTGSAIGSTFTSACCSTGAGAAATAAGVSTSPEPEGEPAPLHLVETAAPTTEAVNDFRSAVATYERALLEDALRRNRYNQRATASALGLSYDQLRHALKRHKLQDSAA